MVHQVQRRKLQHKLHVDLFHLFYAELRLHSAKAVIITVKNPMRIFTRVPVGLIRGHGEHVLSDVDAQFLIQNHLMELLVVFRVIHQHLNL